MRSASGEGPLEGAIPVEFRTLVALAATMACGAVAANATSSVQTAREQEAAPLPAIVGDPAGTVPESPLSIAGALVPDEALQIQLGTPDPDQRTASLLALPLERGQQ
jgi:hypothetical protein